MRFKKGGILRFYHAQSFIPGAHGTDIRTSCDTQLSYSHNSRSIFEIEQFDAFGSFVFSPLQITGEQTEVECLHKFVTYSASLLRNSAGCERVSNWRLAAENAKAPEEIHKRSEEDKASSAADEPLDPATWSSQALAESLRQARFEVPGTAGDVLKDEFGTELSGRHLIGKVDEKYETEAVLLDGIHSLVKIFPVNARAGQS
jgi:hypothetical protein